jgi:multisubunit Na+/H+ antiporter MnhB subunit
VLLSIYALGFIRGGFRRLHRYRHRSEVEVIEPVPSPHLARDLLFGWCSVATGSNFLLCATVGGGTLILLVIGTYYTDGKPGDWMPTQWQTMVPSIYERGPGLDFIVYFVTIPVMLLLAIELLLGGGRKLLSYPRLHGTQMQLKEALLASRPMKALVLASLWLIAGIIGLSAISFLVGFLILAGKCMYYTEGKLPIWFPANLFTGIGNEWCQSVYESGWGANQTFLLLLLVSTSSFTIRALCQGVRRIRSFRGASTLR